MRTALRSDGVGRDYIDRHAQSLSDEFCNRGDWFGYHRRVADRSAHLEIRRDEAVTPARQILADDRNVPYQPIHRVERDEADFHIDRVVAKPQVPSRSNLHYRAR